MSRVPPAAACPVCDRPIPAASAGRTIRCPDCLRLVAVPTPSARPLRPQQPPPTVWVAPAELAVSTDCPTPAYPFPAIIDGPA